MHPVKIYLLASADHIETVYLSKGVCLPSCSSLSIRSACGSRHVLEACTNENRWKTRSCVFRNAHSPLGGLLNSRCRDHHCRLHSCRQDSWDRVIRNKCTVTSKTNEIKKMHHERCSQDSLRWLLSRMPEPGLLRTRV